MADLRYTVDVDTRGATRDVNNLKSTILGASAALGAAFAVSGLKDFGEGIISAARELENYTNQLRLVSNGTQDLERITNLLRETAVSNRTAFGETVDLFTKLRVATEEMGVSEQDVIDVTTKLSQALQVAGADAGTAQGAIRQFGQAMASGTVRGDEFNSLVEALGPALAIMARESGISVGELRRMSQAGELTADVFFNMLKNSNSLTDAFNKMQPTIEQLETQLNDAFTLALSQIGEATGLTQLYKDALNGVLELLTYITQTEEGIQALNTALQTLAALLAAIFSAALARTIVSIAASIGRVVTVIRTLGTVAAAAAAGAALLTPAGWVALGAAVVGGVAAWFGFGKALDGAREKAAAAKETQEEMLADTGELNDEMQGVAENSTTVAEQAKVTAAEIKKQVDETNRLVKNIDAVSDNFAQSNTALIQSLGFTRDRLELEAQLVNASDATKESKLAMLDYEQQHIARVRDLNAQLEAALNSTQQNEQVIAAIQAELQQVQQEYDNNLATVEQLTEQIAQQRAEQERILAIKRDSVAASEQLLDFQDRLNESTRLAQQEFDQLNMTEFEKELDNIRRRLDFGLQRQIQRINALTIDPDVKTALIETLRKETEKAIEQQQRLARESRDHQRTFGYGWQKAFEEYAENATNSARRAEDIFRTATEGMEELIVGFAKTGKFEWRGFVNELTEMLLRSQIKELIADVFGGSGVNGSGSGSSGGGFLSKIGSFFAGFFANGGNIPAGQFGVVGENGPEFISGPATITPMSGSNSSTSITYNINAVDAISFKQLVASDPEFIHAVAMNGGSSLAYGR